MANTIPLPEKMTPRSAFMHGVKSWITLSGGDVPPAFTAAGVGEHWSNGWKAAAIENENSGQRPTWGPDVADIADKYGYVANPPTAAEVDAAFEEGLRVQKKS